MYDADRIIEISESIKQKRSERNSITGVTSKVENVLNYQGCPAAMRSDILEYVKGCSLKYTADIDAQIQTLADSIITAEDK